MIQKIIPSEDYNKWLETLDTYEPLILSEPTNQNIIVPKVVNKTNKRYHKILGLVQ